MPKRKIKKRRSNLKNTMKKEEDEIVFEIG